MSDFTYQGPADIDRAIGYFVGLDDSEKDALAVIEFDGVIDELQAEYEKASADPAYRPTDDFLVRLGDYLGMAGDSATA
ncbi:hypothetical protein EDF46_0907 [Frondihabitans sp. PhB188]|uniref:hypothetical protein n=1 Tax=Frondihabitans sp. PhB188 TaxID=2485200 RepID=UPI000F47BE36|nr:hypothetical protein [Frondihabitans sp. PhB188]ROQ41527.1 hypothetical protein EDF46_0907 [Frondihabitans sp. PhB188]